VLIKIDDYGVALNPNSQLLVIRAPRLQDVVAYVQSGTMNMCSRQFSLAQQDHIINANGMSYHSKELEIRT